MGEEDVESAPVEALPTLEEDLTYLATVAQGLKECEEREAAAKKVASLHLHYSAFS